MSQQSQEALEAGVTAYEVAILKNHEINDSSRLVPGKVYLKLLHGRDSPQDQPDDWGFEGPWIGPLKYVHFTYSTLGSIGFENGEEIAVCSQSITIADDLLQYDGKFYGDWEVQVA